MAVSFDLFGTLVDADRPAAPWHAVADTLAEHDVRVPEDWEAAYRTSHREYDRGREAPLDEHVRLALASRGVDVTEATARGAVLAAFDAPVAVREGARPPLRAAADRGPVGICSNCSVPDLVERTLDRAGLADAVPGGFDTVVTSVDCGWRKPHPEIFETTAAALDVPLAALVHVGDDARTDGGAGRVGAQSVLLDDVALPTVAEQLREGSLC
ncbi:HAD family hydrolase [Halomicroarcula sp. GCM10025817]|uniref:HAD family hydrolase n=1 Tax=Haloarcula TaxID=2237 RepID=UPI0023E7A69F|nr:HAD family hydrolase [Halomicroarcula sp. SYNS111]